MEVLAPLGPVAEQIYDRVLLGIVEANDLGAYRRAILIHALHHGNVILDIGGDHLP